MNAKRVFTTVSMTIIAFVIWITLSLIWHVLTDWMPDWLVFTVAVAIVGGYFWHTTRPKDKPTTDAPDAERLP